MLILILTFLISFRTSAQQQSIGEVFSKISRDSVIRYAQTITNSTSADLNSGLFQVTKDKNIFSFYIGVKAIGSFLNDNERFPGKLQGISIVPLAVIQVGVGSFVGNDLFFRFLPKISVSNLGSIDIWGAGIQHDLAKDFKKIPLKIIFQASTHHLRINDSKENDLFELNSFSFNVMLSKKFGVITPYATIQYENANADLAYKVTVSSEQTVKTSFESNNNFRVVTGLNLKLGAFNINADYNFGKQRSISSGIGLGF